MEATSSRRSLENRAQVACRPWLRRRRRRRQKASCRSSRPKSVGIPGSGRLISVACGATTSPGLARIVGARAQQTKKVAAGATIRNQSIISGSRLTAAPLSSPLSPVIADSCQAGSTERRSPQGAREAPEDATAPRARNNSWRPAERRRASRN